MSFKIPQKIDVNIPIDQKMKFKLNRGNLNLTRKQSATTDDNLLNINSLKIDEKLQVPQILSTPIDNGRKEMAINYDVKFEQENNQVYQYKSLEIKKIENEAETNTILTETSGLVSQNQQKGKIDITELKCKLII